MWQLLFRKILLGFQACHNIGVYNLDIKIDNILLDNHFNPKISDFGLGSNNPGLLTESRGTKNYMPPQMLENKEYTGVKADIFNLGSLLFIIVVGYPCFNYAIKTDYYYKHIVAKDNQFFTFLGNKFNIVNTLSLEFKNLLKRMIAYEENDRPDNIQQILGDIWFNGIQENINDLENELNNLFVEKDNTVTTFILVNPDFLEQKWIHMEMKGVYPIDLLMKYFLKILFHKLKILI